MRTASWVRGISFVGAVLLLFAVSYDRWLVTDTESIKVRWGVFHNVEGGAGTAFRLTDVVCDQPAWFEAIVGSGYKPSDQCTSMCNSRKAFAILAVVFAWGATAISSKGAELLFATESKTRTRIAGAIGLFAAASCVVVLGLFSYGQNTKQETGGSSGLATGVCVYDVTGASPEMGVSGYVASVGTALVGLCSIVLMFLDPTSSSYLDV